MRADELRGFLRAEPFVPFRLHISSGQQVDITHPETCLVTRSLVSVASLDEDGELTFRGHYNLIHVVEIELLGDRKKRSRNGRTSKKR